MTRGGESSLKLYSSKSTVTFMNSFSSISKSSHRNYLSKSMKVQTKKVTEQ